MSDLFQQIGVHTVTKDGNTLASDHLAMETVVKLSDQEGVFTTLLATPTDLPELLIGHSITEGYGLPPEAKIIVTASEGGYSVQAIEHTVNEIGKSRSDQIVSTSCGACNSPGVENLITHLPAYIGSHTIIDLNWLNQSFELMKTKQIGFSKTGGMHAAGLFKFGGGEPIVCEDIGRHNAVDKAVGTSASLGQEMQDTVLLLSGRCGWDIVAKSARAGIGTIACVGACSTLAAETARALGMRIFSFVKPHRSIGIGYIHPAMKDNP
jgi:FdhD protein